MAVHGDRSQVVHSSVRPEVAPPDPDTANGKDGYGFDNLKWRDFTDQWFEENPRYIVEPYGGISALARAMAEADGNVKPYTDYKSTAKEYFDDFRGMHEEDDGGDSITLEELREMGEPLYIDGKPLPPDPSRTIRPQGRK